MVCRSLAVWRVMYSGYGAPQCTHTPRWSDSRCAHHARWRGGVERPTAKCLLEFDALRSAKPFTQVRMRASPVWVSIKKASESGLPLRSFNLLIAGPHSLLLRNRADSRAKLPENRTDLLELALVPQVGRRRSITQQLCCRTDDPWRAIEITSRVAEVNRPAP
jgi:hypothetical protein